MAFLASVDGDFYRFDEATLTTTLVGHPNCAAGAGPYTMTASREGDIYALYTDWHLYKIDPSTFACTLTPFVSIGSANVGVAVQRADGDEWLYVYANNGQPELERADLVTFQPKSVGFVTHPPPAYPLDFQSDVYGRLFGATASGIVVQIDPKTGASLGQDDLGTAGATSWALLALGKHLYFFGAHFAATTSYLTGWDPDAKTVFTTGTVPFAVVAAAAAPCRL
jgi:hypothetical protein